MNTERFHFDEKLAERIAIWGPADGRLLYVVDNSFTGDDAPDVQKFDVSSGDVFGMDQREAASRYTIGSISTWDEFLNECNKLELFIGRASKSIVAFQLTSIVVTVYIGLQAISDDEYPANPTDLNDFVEYFDDPKYGVDLAPHLRHIFRITSYRFRTVKIERTLDSILHGFIPTNLRKLDKIINSYDDSDEIVD